MRLSVIVPAFREAEKEARQIHRLARHPRIFEVIVAAADCSTGFNRYLRRIPKVKLCQAPRKGRGAQMNFGASIAKGDLLLFLHADSWPEEGGIEELVEKMKERSFVGGTFQLKFHHPDWRYRLKAWGTNLRSKMLGMPYGDQGYFMWADLFKQLDGYKNWRLFEDVNFFDRLKKRGDWVLLESAVSTSTRRWEKQGYWKATLKNAFWVILYKLGTSPHWLAEHY